MSNLEKNPPQIDAGFMVVLTFEAQYRKYLQDRDYVTDWEASYCMPLPSVPPEKMAHKYRGTDREALDAFTGSDNPGESFLGGLEDQNNADGSIIRNFDDAKTALSMTPDKADREIIWVKSMFSQAEAPNGYVSVGFEPVWFASGFSALCDCMHFMRWHGTDDEGTAFAKYMKLFNGHGLFKTKEVAIEYIDFYLSFDWAEHGEYDIAEVFVRD